VPWELYYSTLRGPASILSGHPRYHWMIPSSGVAWLFLEMDVDLPAHILVWAEKGAEILLISLQTVI